jgi:hypothetical protein
MDFTSIFTGVKPTEKKMQLYFNDDDSMIIRRLEIDATVLIERVKGVIVAAFKHFYKLEYDFEGYSKIPPGKLSLGFSRDVVLDLFNNLDEQKDGITKGKQMNRPWITEISKNSFYKIKQQKANSFFMDKFTTACVIIVAAEAIGILLKILL